MGKKNFTGIDAFLKPDEVLNKKTAADDIQRKKTNKKERRATFQFEEDQLETIKALAYWERTTTKSLLFEALEMLFQSKDNKLVEKARQEYAKNLPQHDE